MMMVVDSPLLFFFKKMIKYMKTKPRPRLQKGDVVQLLYRCEAHISDAVLKKTERASSCQRLRVHFEDEHVAIVEKPPGLAMSGMGDARFHSLSLNELLIMSLAPSHAECGAHTQAVDSGSGPLIHPSMIQGCNSLTHSLLQGC